VQLEFLKDGDHNVLFVVAPNRVGKTQCGARAVTWWLQDKHPYVPRRKEWGNGGFNILVVGRTTQHLDNEIWDKKLRKYLPPGSYKEKRGNSLTHVEHLKTRNKLIFMSHHDAINAREKVQGFTAPIVWVDEMPDDVSLITELILRTVTNNGIFIATFTPLIENEEIKKIVEASSTNKKKYVLRVEDNPKIAARLADYESELRSICATEAEYRARRYGEWYYRSGRVYRAYLPDMHKQFLPPHYSEVHWRHTVVVDPSASGLTGATLWAEDPTCGVWWCVKAKKMEGAAAYLLVRTVEAWIEGYNVVKRLCDCNPAGYYHEALRQKIAYEVVNDKQGRKFDTIEAVNKAFSTRAIMLSSDVGELEDELLMCKWSESNSNKIIHESKWHLSDTLRYFVDRKPAPPAMYASYDTERQAIKQEWNKALEGKWKKQAIEKKQQEKKQQRQQRMNIVSRRSRW
jgi:phage terminase large subunit-like protein